MRIRKGIRMNQNGTEKRRKSRGRQAFRNMAALSFLLAFSLCMPVAAASASSGAAIVSQGFDAIYTIIAAIVSSVGTLLLLWGIFEWAQALNTQDGGAQSMAFKRIASGLVATIGPQLVPVITASVGV